MRYNRDTFYIPESAVGYIDYNFNHANITVARDMRMAVTVTWTSWKQYIAVYFYSKLVRAGCILSWCGGGLNLKLKREGYADPSPH